MIIDEQITDYWLFTDYWLMITDYWLMTDDWWLMIDYWLLIDEHAKLLTVLTDCRLLRDDVYVSETWVTKQLLHDLQAVCGMFFVKMLNC